MHECDYGFIVRWLVCTIANSIKCGTTEIPLNICMTDVIRGWLKGQRKL